MKVEVAASRRVGLTADFHCTRIMQAARIWRTEDRLLFPKLDGERVSWDHALTRVTDQFKKIIEQHGPDSAAFYLSGQ